MGHLFLFYLFVYFFYRGISESLILSKVFLFHSARLERFSKHRADICISHRLRGSGISPGVGAVSKGTRGGDQ